MRRILIGLIICTISYLLLRHNEWLIRQTGTSAWAEKWFGTEGGTRLVLKLLAIFAFVVGMLVIFNMHARFIKWLLSPLFGTPLTYSASLATLIRQKLR